MFYTGNIQPWRRIFFITLALVFFPSFIANLIDERGRMMIESSQVVNSETPFCHLVIPLTLIPMVFQRVVIFPGRLMNHYASIYSMLTIWVFMTLFLGRGWCSWVCFYGGWDDGASRLSSKTRVKMDSNQPWVQHLPRAVLLFLVLGALVTLTSIYCDWFCPFKLITEFEEPNNIKSMISMVLMVLSFFAFLLVLPFLTRRRFNCGLLCPLGAMQGIIGSRISPFKVSLDKEKCTGCGKCETHCPTFSMEKGVTRRSCTLCGECIDICPTGALDITLGKEEKGWLKGPGILKELIRPRNLFILSAFTAGMIISFGFALDTLSMAVSLFTGGIK